MCVVTNTQNEIHLWHNVDLVPDIIDICAVVNGHANVMDGFCSTDKVVDISRCASINLT